MEIKYKGHKAKLTYNITAESCMGPHYGTIKLDSTICSYKLDDIAIGTEEHKCIEEVFIRWFKNKVDGKDRVI